MVAHAISCVFDADLCDLATQKPKRLRRIHPTVARMMNRVFERATLHSYL